MARWTDLAVWKGPTVNRDAGGTVETRGVVVHIAEGTYEGTISWQLNASAQVSSHFIVDRNGQIAQMVDTNDKAWTQKAGNGHWISVECAGFTTGSQYHTPGSERLTDAQVAAVGRILAKAHQVYGVPLQIATSPSGKGLGHHSMGGTAWGHLDCPGDLIISQKSAILAAAQGGPTMADGFTADDRNRLSELHDLMLSWSQGSAVIAGKSYQVEPVKWEVAMEGWRSKTDATLAALAAAANIDAAELAKIQQAAQAGASAALTAQMGQMQTAITTAVEAALPASLDDTVRASVLAAIHDAAASVAAATA